MPLLPFLPCLSWFGSMEEVGKTETNETGITATVSLP
jgi:hypothetical protein